MQEKQNSITLGDIFHVLWKNIILLAAITVGVLILGIIYTFAIATPTYKSSASIIVAVESNSSTTDVDYSDSVRATYTVASAIDQNSVLKPVVDAYNEDAADGEVTIAGTTDTVKVSRKSITIDALKSKVNVSYTTNTFLITISVTDSDPVAARAFAALIQNQVVEEAVQTKTDGSTGVFFFAANSISKSGIAETGTYASPNKKLYVIVSFLVGLVLGVIVIFVKEFMSNKFKTKEEIEHTINERVIGYFPDKKIKEKKGQKEVALVEASIRNFEPYNKLLSNIKYSNLETPYKVILFTSTLADELKSTIASNLAYTIANNNQKVIILDLDIRKSILHKTFKVEKENGIVDYSAGDATKDQIIKHSEYGVDVITAGKEVLNPIAVLETTKVKELIEELRAEYDYIILDTPPCLACSDAKIVSPNADGIIFNIALNQAKKKDILESIHSLGDAEAKIIGLSITKGENKKRDSYYYYYNQEEK